ncbi:hypothetical protein M902_1245 [Bacteriovorax sp. BAL6_X]|nr:hypothetical protein M902_1245 [Bacteriovorax sp. BAL6_X]
MRCELRKATDCFRSLVGSISEKELFSNKVLMEKVCEALKLINFSRGMK